MTAERSRKAHLTRAAALRGCWRDDRGVTAVELAFVLPVLLLLLSGIIQFGALMFLQNHMTNIARETARRVAVGELTTAAAVQSAQTSLINWGISYGVVVTEPDPLDPNDTDVVVDITAPMSQAALVDVLGIFQTGTLRAKVTMRQE
ncbi:MAG: TadE/TadG family type IV pilus assembly protein [Kiloniellaceae bacterium]